MSVTAKARRWPLSLKILLPLILGSFIVVSVGWTLLKYQYMHEMEKQTHRRATALVNSVEQFLWIVGISSPEMVRIVDSLGAEKDIKMIAIFRLDTSEIITNSGGRQSTQNLKTHLSQQYPTKDILQALETGKPFHGKVPNIDTHETDYIVVAPVLLKDHATTKPVSGTIMVQLEISEFLIDMNRQLRFMAIGFVTSILLIAVLTYLLFQRYIFQPIHDIKGTIDQRARGNASAYATILREDEIGAVGHALNMLLDRQKNYEAEIKRSHAIAVKASTEAEKASEAKSQFLANMSHELRTPLNSILGMMRLMKDTSLNTEQCEMVNTVFQSSKNLLEIVNDILDLSKIEADEMQLERIGFDVTYVLDSVIHILMPLSKEKHLDFKAQFDKSTFPYLVGDPLRLTRVLTNMVGNALKYTDRGRVDLRVSCQKIDPQHVEIHCEVEDTGIGIAPHKIATIFDKFVQADTSTTRKFGGTGLGLAITKELVELMGGKIGVESEIDKGSTFWFKIPFEITDQLTEEKRIRKSKRKKGSLPPDQARILIAEDHPLNQIYVKKLMERFGIGYFEIAHNGQEALNKYKESRWDVILMDCHMPEKNGYDATEEIRNLEEEAGKHVPIVAMTANAMVGEREKCLRYGMDDYTSKPINIDELQDILGQWLHFEDVHDTSQEKRASSVTPAVNLSFLHDVTNGDKDMNKEFVHVFMTQTDQNIQTLEDACKNDAQKWREICHLIKGGSGLIGAENLSNLCEKGQHFDGNPQDRQALYHEIKQAYEEVKEFLRQQDLV